MNKLQHVQCKYVNNKLMYVCGIMLLSLSLDIPIIPEAQLLIITVYHIQIIHEEGIIHNDLKPDNFVCSGLQLKLIDFGIANKIEEEHTSIERDIRCGTANYMPPECIMTHDDEDYFKVLQI